MAKRTLPQWFAFDWETFWPQVEHLDNAQLGALLRLMKFSWHQCPPCSISSTDPTIPGVVRMTSVEWSECKQCVLAMFTLGSDGRFHWPWYRSRFDESRRLMELKSKGGRNSAAKRAKSQESCKSLERVLQESSIANAPANAVVLDTGGCKGELPAALDVPAFRESWARWLAYRREIHKTLKPASQATLLARLAKFGHDWSVERIEKAIGNGWQGLVFDEDKPPDDRRESADEWKSKPYCPG